ncbi:MAG: phospholipase D-like domain-containing protein [Draconibacterium sp.]|nr:phospholipase D-like domain-containing protein [Draconibacterium sp.]
MKLFTLLLLTIAAFQTVAQQNIADVRSLPEGNTATISGIVTNGDELGSVRYVQDATGGLAIYDTQLGSVKRGDSITVTGEIHPYNNLFEITTVSSFTVHTSGNPIPPAKILTIDQIGEDYEGQLIQINNIEIENANGTFDGGKNYNFSDGQRTGEYRINTGSPIIGQVIPTSEINLIAICSQYSRESNDTRSGYQLLPRTMEDFESNNAINITSSVQIASISKTGFTLFWSTDIGGSSQVIYGTNNNQSSWTNFAVGSSNAMGNFHQVIITELNPATIIYAKVFSVFNTDTAFSSIGVFATKSNSSGDIKVYFNTPVNTDLSTGTIAQYIGKAMNDTLIAYINRAKETIDFCIYNINNSGLSNVSEALNSAHNRGVRIRFITSGSTAHTGADDLVSGIPVIESPYNSETGIMHNKFAIFDANSNDASKPWVWSGSTNLTYDQINSDANNMVFIQDQSLALAYQIEFEEMWGSDGNQPNGIKSKFGAAKTDNTPHEFIVGGNRIQSYFSPSDGTNQQIINAINTADNDLNVETMLITRSDLANSIRKAEERGVEVQVITNSPGGNTSTVNDILNAALPTGKFVFDNSANATLHHKLAIVDANYVVSDPQVITGSHNWSNSANNRNDENTLIIHNAEIANQYFQQFAYRFAENGGDLLVSAKSIEIEKIKVYPNPTIGRVIVSSQIPISKILLIDLSGKLIQEIISGNSNLLKIEMQNEIPGIYILKVKSSNGKQNSYKIIKR